MVRGSAGMIIAPFDKMQTSRAVFARARALAGK